MVSYVHRSTTVMHVIHVCPNSKSSHCLNCPSSSSNQLAIQSSTTLLARCMVNELMHVHGTGQNIYQQNQCSMHVMTCSMDVCDSWCNDTMIMGRLTSCMIMAALPSVVRLLAAGLPQCITNAFGVTSPALFLLLLASHSHDTWLPCLLQSYLCATCLSTNNK